MTIVDGRTETSGQFRHALRVRAHEFFTDVNEAEGGKDSAPGPHDYFDASLAACKAATAMWYAKRQGFPLETVDVHVESDASEERAGKYKLTVRVTFHGPLTPEQRERLTAAVGKCPIHRLITQADITIETSPQEAP